MTAYTPFLRAKGGEFKAINQLACSDKEKLRPFFDLPKIDEDCVPSEDEFLTQVAKIERKCSLNLNNIAAFYLDNKDISDRYLVKGRSNYRAILEIFSGMSVIPVTGINRSSDRQMSVIDAARAGVVSSERVAIRLDFLDIEKYRLVSYEFESLVRGLAGTFKNIVLIYDLGVIKPSEISECIRRVGTFGAAVASFFIPETTILTGSSIPGSIADIAKPETQIEFDRSEIAVFNEVSTLFPTKLDLGDYATVSPLYSGADIPVEAMQNVTAPKIIYAYKDKQFVIRGGALRSHPRKQEQYYDLCSVLASKPYFRGAAYSNGDSVFYEKSHGIEPRLTPTHAVAPMVNAHITYMVRSS